MPGSGSIGGGRSAEIKFLIKELKGDPDDKAKQDWKGTDSHVVSGNQTCKITVTFSKVPTPVGSDGKKFRVDLEDGKCVDIDW